MAYSNRLSFPGQMKSRLRIHLLVLAFILSACSWSGSTTAPPVGTAIAIEELPEGTGRGFATVLLDSNERGRELREGSAPPNFYLTLEDGRSVSLRDLRGQPVLINFWASWCGPCRLEMPDIVKHAQANPELIVVAINVQESLEVIQPFAEEFQMNLPVARDIEGALREQYAVHGMPTTVFIGRDGRVFTIWEGMVSAGLLDEILADMQ